MMSRLLIYVCFLFLGVKAFAQNAHLRITGLINFPDTAYQGVSYPVGIVLKNVGFSPFQGPLQVILQTDSAYDILYYSQNPNFALFPNDTVTLLANQGGTFGYQFTSQVFKPGNDVVVVWPYSTQMNVDYDSIYTSVYYVPLSSVANNNGFEKSVIKAWPNPFYDQINLDLSGGQIVEQVRVFSIDGREYPVQLRGSVLYLHNFHPGVYLMEIRLTDNTFYYSRMVKTE
jgi:hypothetical protein